MNEKKRLKEIIRKQDEIKLKAQVRRNLRIWNKLEKKQQPRPQMITHVMRIKDRHLLQFLCGTLSERNHARYAAMYRREMIEQMVEERPLVKAKWESINNG
jgi:hypothetical protein